MRVVHILHVPCTYSTLSLYALCVPCCTLDSVCYVWCAMMNDVLWCGVCMTMNGARFEVSSLCIYSTSLIPVVIWVHRYQFLYNALGQ